METNQEIDVKRLVKEGLSEKSVVRRLVQTGMSEQDAREQYFLASEAIQDAYTIRYRFVWILILAAVLCLAFVILPLNITGKNPIAFGILLSLLISVPLLQTIEVFDSFSTFWLTCISSDYHRKPKLHMVIIFFIPILFSFGLSFYYNWEVKHELETKGIDTWASIKEVERLTPVNDSNQVSGPASHRILIGFTPKGAEEEIEQYCFVTDFQFQNAHIGNPIAVRYSARYPEFFTVNLSALDKEVPSQTIEVIQDGGSLD
jgi:hypothetical protein